MTGLLKTMTQYWTYQVTIRTTLINSKVTMDQETNLQKAVRTKNERKSMERTASTKKTRKIKRKKIRRIAIKFKMSFLILSQNFPRTLL